MNEPKDKITEFLTVLLFALVTVGASMYVIMTAEGIARILLLAVMIAIAIASWSYLRRRFGRA